MDRSHDGKNTAISDADAGNGKKIRRLARRTHDIAEVHRWQLHVAASIYALRPNMMMGFEMFPRRLQPVLDEWVDGKLDTKTFLEKSEWFSVWGFLPELYLPLFHFCRQNRIRMLALNCYRELVTRRRQTGMGCHPRSRTRRSDTCRTANRSLP